MKFKCSSFFCLFSFLTIYLSVCIVNFLYNFLQTKWWWFQLHLLLSCSVFRGLEQAKLGLLWVLHCLYGFAHLDSLESTTFLSMEQMFWEHLALFISTIFSKEIQLRHGCLLGVVFFVQQVRSNLLILLIYLKQKNKSLHSMSWVLSSGSILTYYFFLKKQLYLVLQ